MGSTSSEAHSLRCRCYSDRQAARGICMNRHDTSEARVGVGSPHRRSHAWCRYSVLCDTLERSKSSPFVQPRERVRGLDGQYALEGSKALPEDAASASEADDTPSTMDSRIGT
jgi:hypothetical protein